MQKEVQEYEYNERVMGTNLSVALICDSKELADEIAQETIKEIRFYEETFSRFLPNSELSKLNEEKIRVVPPIFIAVLKKARELFVETDGAFNPLVQIGRFGYNKTFSEIENARIENEKTEKGNDHDESYNVNFESVIIDEKENRVTLQAGQKLDFGGMLKGYVAELMAKKIMETEKEGEGKVQGVIVNIGGDIYTCGVDAGGQKFVFEIYNPITKDNAISAPLFNEALCTSGTYKRVWKKSNDFFHHILDASGTQNPNTDIVSMSVIASDGARADAFTKLFLAFGPEKALAQKGMEHIKFVLVKNNGEIIKKL